MNVTDGRIARLFTAQTGSLIEHNSPNAGPPRANTYDLVIQLEAGGVVGQSGGDFTVNITAINDNTATPEAGLVPAGNPFNEQFQVPEWQPSGSDFVRTIRAPISIPAGLTGRFHYNVEFTTVGFQIVELAQSNPFILV